PADAARRQHGQGFEASFKSSGSFGITSTLEQPPLASASLTLRRTRSWRLQKCRFDASVLTILRDHVDVGATAARFRELNVAHCASWQLPQCGLPPQSSPSFGITSTLSINLVVPNVAAARTINRFG